MTERSPAVQAAIGQLATTIYGGGDPETLADRIGTLIDLALEDEADRRNNPDRRTAEEAAMVAEHVAAPLPPACPAPACTCRTLRALVHVLALNTAIPLDADELNTRIDTIATELDRVIDARIDANVDPTFRAIGVRRLRG